jgi:hypothetical protein
MSFIEEVSQHSAPVAFSSGWLVRLETHFLGGDRYWGRWEIAETHRADRTGDNVPVKTHCTFSLQQRRYPLPIREAALD